jgi:hypothetical protein
MTHRSRRWGSRLTRIGAAVAAAAVLGAGHLFAQGTTGKIEGFVRDQAGAPISGAQVIIVGSAFSATSNEQGYYFINNVPAGVMTVRGQYIGYAPAEVQNVRVLAGQTMTVNITLEQRAVEVEGITITVQLNPIVPRDQVTSRSTIAGPVIEQLPADDLRQILRLQPGVVEGGRGLTIRGGRPGEAALYIDGVLVRNMNAQFVSQGANPGVVSVGTNAVEEASITTGAIGAEFGDAQSGVISLVTRAGGQDLSGSLSYSTDEVSGQTYGLGLNRVEASFGGPLPLARNLTFFVASTFQGSQTGGPNQQFQGRGRGAEDVPTWVMSGLETGDTLAPNGYVIAPRSPGDPFSDSSRVDIIRFIPYSTGSRLPDDNWDNWTFSTKLNYSYGTGSRMSLTYHQSRQQDLFFRGGNLYNPQAQRGSRQSSRALVLNWAQNLTRSSSNALTFEGNLSFQSDQFLSGLLQPGFLEDNRSPFGWFTFSSFEFLTNFDNFPVNDQLVRNLRNNNCELSTGGRCTPYLGRNEFQSVGPYRSNPYGVSPGSTFFPSAGYGTAGPTLARESRVAGRFQFDWQANRYNRVKFGGDFTRADMSAYFSNLISQIFSDAYHETPLRYGLFAQNRVDLGDVVIELGLRYDRLNSGIMYPRYPGRIFSDPLRDGLTPDPTSPTGYADFRGRAPTAEDIAVANRCAALLAANDSTGWSTCNMVEAPSRGALAPSVRVSFPVTDRTGFRLSYAHQTQTPDFSLLAGGANADLNFTNTNDIFARDLNFGRSILFEFGIRHAFSDDLVLDISAYNKDKVSDITARVTPVFDPTTGTIQNINMVANADFGNSRGLEMLLDRRVGQLFQGRLSYTYQSAKSTGSDPFEYLSTLARQTSSLTGDRTPPPTALLTTRDNRTHTIAGTASLQFPRNWRSGTLAGSILGDGGVFATFRFASGLGYTRLENIGRGQQGPGTDFGLGGTSREPLNSSSMPWIKTVDLRLTRGFRVGPTTVTTFADFRNLFNFSNLVAIWAETGDVRNQLHRNNTIDPVRQTLANEAGNLLATRSVTRDGATRSLQGYDLSDCSRYNYNNDGTAGVPNCLYLRGAERRYGDGDGFFDTEEQASAFNAWYDFFNGPHTLRGPGFNLRIGFEINF